jgi:hypothetical protein
MVRSLGIAGSSIIGVCVGIGAGVMLGRQGHAGAGYTQVSGVIASSSVIRPQPGRLPFNAEAAKAEAEKIESVLLARMAAEPTDPSWAPTAEQSLRNGLQIAGETGHLQPGRVECRTTMCSADLRWATCTQGPPPIAPILMYRYGDGCTTFANAPWPVPDPSSGCDGKLVLDCGAARSGKSGP